MDLLSATVSEGNPLLSGSLDKGLSTSILKDSLWLFQLLGEPKERNLL